MEALAGNAPGDRRVDRRASEKLVKALRPNYGLRVAADHDLETLVDELPHDDPWRAKLHALKPLSAYATRIRGVSGGAYALATPAVPRCGFDPDQRKEIWSAASRAIQD